METLIFQLHAPLSSWGEVAVGEYRPTADYPSQSAIVGLLAAAFGIKREDEAAQIALNNGYKRKNGIILCILSASSCVLGIPFSLANSHIFSCSSSSLSKQ